MIHPVNELMTPPILGDSEIDPDESHSRYEIRYLGHTRREMKLVNHGKEFSNTANALHSSLSQIHGQSELNSPELSKEEIEKITICFSYGVLRYSL
jgi:hypothetical protein